MRFINGLSVFIVSILSSLCDIRMVYSWVVVMSLEVVFRGDVIRNTSTLAMTRDDEIVFPVLLDNLVGLFLSRFRSRRVGGTTCYLPVYEPILNKVLRFADRIISRTPIRDDGLCIYKKRLSVSVYPSLRLKLNTSYTQSPPDVGR